IPLLPLAGFLINGLCGKWLPKAVSGTIGAGVIFASAVMTVSLFLKVQAGTTPVPMTYTLFDWIKVGGFSIPFAILIDPLSIIMILIVTCVGFLIHLYSIGYMWKDEGFARFFAYLNLFTFSMLLLVMGNNFALLFIGWEGVGLCSYLLIGFWFKNNAYNKAAVKAFVMNRIGDLGFILGIFLIVTHFGSLVFTDVFEAAQSRTLGEPVIVWIAIFLFIGAVGKSAQIPLYTWLPDAMAGPTPVSALIHAATMGIAGVYMVIRSNVLYTHAPLVLDLIAAVGMATALLAALIALTQTDIKKVLAYSTVSQLGYMFVALGVGAYTSSLFHVITHAFFKALLFLAAGSVIHALHEEQDIRRMGGLRKSIPITYWTFFIGTLAIASIPPFSGFFSKDEILLNLFEHNKLLWGFALLGSFLTTFYMFRLFFLTFHGEFRGSAETKSHIHESPLVMTIPLMLLALLSLGGGIIGLPEVIGSHHWL
ncbi:MAG: NADH-quinone oxidoreductase subunit L, partial [Spirochaetia bacterium]|nr:NADH-quinone oxidoreductase subunit L [Spirochaetia bacterium]